MNFEQFLNQAWNDHAVDSVDVALRLPDALELITSNEQIPLLAALATHVFGEHQAKWEEGVAYLVRLKSLPVFAVATEAERSIERSIASLEVASGKRTSLNEFSTSEQIRVLAVAAAALSEQKDANRASVLFRKAIELFDAGISKDDPANRFLAVTGNNLACALEGVKARTSHETELMILSAQTARKFWEIAGTWLHVERAEYRLSNSYRTAGDLVRALDHAQLCIEISRANDAPALEIFFGYEALALVEKARGNAVGQSKAVEQMKAQFNLLSSDDKKWCEDKLSSV